MKYALKRFRDNVRAPANLSLLILEDDGLREGINKHVELGKEL